MCESVGCEVCESVKCVALTLGAFDATFRLPSDFFDSGVKPAVSYSDSESENEDSGNRTVSTGNQLANSTTESKAEQREEISTR